MTRLTKNKAKEKIELMKMMMKRNVRYFDDNDDSMIIMMMVLICNLLCSNEDNLILACMVGGFMNFIFFFIKFSMKNKYFPFLFYKLTYFIEKVRIILCRIDFLK